MNAKQRLDRGVFINKGYAALRRSRNALEWSLDADAPREAQKAMECFLRQAAEFRAALAKDAPEDRAPPGFLTDPPSSTWGRYDWEALRLELPDRLFEAMRWIRLRRRLALKALGFWRIRFFRAVLLTGILCLALATAAGGRDLWRWRERMRVLEERATFTADLFDGARPLPANFKVSGLLPLECEGTERWRWALGPTTMVAFALPLPRTVRLEARVNNPVPGQELVVTANGERALTVSIPDVQPWMKQTTSVIAEFPGREGLNVVTIEYRGWNHQTVTFAPNDPHPLALAFTAFTVTTRRP